MKKFDEIWKNNNNARRRLFVRTVFGAELNALAHFNLFLA